MSSYMKLKRRIWKLCSGNKYSQIPYDLDPSYIRDTSSGYGGHLYHVIFCLFDLILFVHSTIFQLCGTVLPGFNQY